jgi:hypothetical protein
MNRRATAEFALIPVFIESAQGEIVYNFISSNSGIR